MVIQGLRQAKRRPILLQIAMRHLRQTMHARIRPTRCCDRMGAGLELCQGRFDRTLHRGLIGLTLPPSKGRAVIFDFESDPNHACP